VGRCQKRAMFLLCEAFRSERRAIVKSGRCSSSARPSDRRLDRLSGLSFRCLGQPKSGALVHNVGCWAEPLLGSRSLRDLGFMNPTGAPEPLGDSGGIVWGIFVLMMDAHERTHRCSPQAPWRFGQNHLGVSCCQQGRFHFVIGCVRAHSRV